MNESNEDVRASNMLSISSQINNDLASSQDQPQTTYGGNRIQSIEIVKAEWHNSQFVSGHRMYQIKSIVSMSTSNERMNSMDQLFEVYRRFKDFESLYHQLLSRFTECIIPPLPVKSLKDKIVKDDNPFVEKRKSSLLQFLLRISDHYLLGQSEEFMEFIKDDKFYHQGNAVGGVTGQVKILWNHLPDIKGYIIKSPNQNFASEMFLDSKLEQEYQKQVVIGSKLLSNYLYNLKTSLQNQSLTLDKKVKSLQKFSKLYMYVEPSNEPSDRLQENYQQNIKDDLETFSKDAESEQSIYRDKFFKEVNFYYNYLQSLQNSIAKRQEIIDTCNKDKNKQSSNDRKLQIYQKIKDITRGLQSEYYELCIEIERKIVDCIENIQKNYIQDQEEELQQEEQKEELVFDQ